jgi:hypothetical protein
MPQVIHNERGNAETLSCLLGRRAIYPTGLRIRVHFIRIRIQHFRLNTDPIRL